MTPFEIVTLVLALLLALSGIPIVYRMIVGPTILDRAVATDTLVVLLVIAMGLYTARTGAAWAGPAMLGLTATAFIATVAVARFVGRETVPQDHSEEPSTDTGPLRSIAEPMNYPSTDTGVFVSMRPTDPHEGAGPERRDR